MTQFRRMALGLAAALGLLALATPEPAEAAFKLMLTTGSGFSQTVTDNGVGDVNSGLDGSILFSGTVNGFDLVVSSGRSKPLIGSEGPDGPAEMSLNIDVTASEGSEADTLTIKLTDTDFQQEGQSTFAANYAASTVGAPASASTITFSAFKDFENDEFGEDGAQLLPGEFDPDGTVEISAGQSLAETSGDASEGVLDQPPYSMTLVTLLEFGGGELAANYSINAINSNVIPEPGAFAMALSALPLLGCVAGYRRWRRHEQA